MLKWLISGAVLLLAGVHFLVAYTEPRRVAPGEAYSNTRQSETEYVVLALKPGQQFTNSTDREFIVLSKEELFGFDLTSKVSGYQQKIDASLSDLDDLDKEIAEKEKSKENAASGGAR